MQVAGGWLMQGADDLSPEAIEFTVVSEKQPTAQQLEVRWGALTLRQSAAAGARCRAPLRARQGGVAAGTPPLLVTWCCAAGLAGHAGRARAVHGCR
jgi:hypothetical protein